MFFVFGFFFLFLSFLKCNSASTSFSHKIKPLKKKKSVYHRCYAKFWSLLRLPLIYWLQALSVFTLSSFLFFLCFVLPFSFSFITYFLVMEEKRKDQCKNRIKIFFFFFFFFAELISWWFTALLSLNNSLSAAPPPA